MKTSLRQLPGLMLAGLLYFVPPAANGQWTYVGTPGFSSGVSSYQTLAQGSDGTLYVAYSDQGFPPSGKGSAMKYNGTAWVPVGTPGFTASSADYGSLAVGPNDTLYFSYQDGPSGKASIMKFDGTDWVQVGTPEISAGTATYTRMEVSPTGTPYVAYIDGATNMACVQMFDGVSWVGLGGGSATVSPGSAGWLTMDLDASGNPWIGFADGTASNNSTVMRFNGTSWVTVGAAGFSTSLSGIIFMDLTISPDNEAYVAYSNPFASVVSSVQKFDGTSWNLVGTAGFNAANSIFNTVTIDTDGTPYLAFMDGSSPASNGSVMRFDASAPAWNYLGAASFSGSNAGYFTSLMDGNSFLYVSYIDGDNGGRTSVMRYQLCNPASYPTISPVSSVCEGDTVTLTLTGTLNDDANWQWYTGGCHDLAAGTGTSIDVVVTDTITFYANGDDVCVYTGDTCASITINPYATPAVPTFTVSGATLTSSSATGNQWLVSGAEIPGATNQTYVIPTAGWYSVTVTNVNGCAATSDSVFVPFTSGINEATQLDASLYPVPFTHTLNLQLPDAGTTIMSILDPQGRVVFTAAHLQNMNSFDLSQLVKGVYYLNLQQDGTTAVYRIVKQ